MPLRGRGPSGSKSNPRDTTLLEYLDPYLPKDGSAQKTIPEYIFNYTEQNRIESAEITYFGMDQVGASDDEDDEDGAENVAVAAANAQASRQERRPASSPPDGSPPTPPRSPSEQPGPAACSTTTTVATATAANRMLERGKTKSSGLDVMAVHGTATAVESEAASLPRSTLSFPQPGQAMPSIDTPAERNDQVNERAEEKVEQSEEEEEALDWNQEIHSAQAVAPEQTAQDDTTEVGDAREEVPTLSRARRKIKDPLAFSDTMSSQASSRAADPADEMDVDPVDARAEGQEELNALDEDGLSDSERANRPARGSLGGFASDGESADDAESVERQSSPIHPASAQRMTITSSHHSSQSQSLSQSQSQDRSFSASQRSTQDRSLSRYSRPKDSGTVDHDPKTPSGHTIVAKQASREDEREDHVEEEEEESTTPRGSPGAGSGALAFLNPAFNAARAVARVVRPSPQAIPSEQVADEVPADPVLEGAAGDDAMDVDEGGVDDAILGEGGEDAAREGEEERSAEPVSDRRVLTQVKQSPRSPERERKRKLETEEPSDLEAKDESEQQEQGEVTEPEDKAAEEDEKADKDDKEEKEEEQEAAYEWPDNFPPPPSPDLPPARHRARAGRTDTPDIKRIFTPAIKREFGSERNFTPTRLVDGKVVKVEVNPPTPGPARKVMMRRGGGRGGKGMMVRQKRERERDVEVEAKKEEVGGGDGMSRAEEDSEEKEVKEVKQAGTPVEPESVESDPRRFDREGKKRKVSPGSGGAVTQGQADEGTTRSVGVDLDGRNGATEDIDMDEQAINDNQDEIEEEEEEEEEEREEEEEQEQQAGDTESPVDSDIRLNDLIVPRDGRKLPLLLGFVPDLEVDFGVDEKFMEGVYGTIEGLKKKAEKKMVQGRR